MTGEVTFQTCAAAAASWWADQLRGPARLDSGDTGPDAGLAAGIAALAQAAEHRASGVTEDKIEVFRRFLEAAIVGERERLDGLGLERMQINLGVDYHPDPILVDATVAADIRVGMTTFPWKTQMWVYATHVSLSHGYRGEVQTIHGTEPARETLPG